MIRMPCRSLAVLALAALPAIAGAQLAAMRPDGGIGYALRGGANMVSGTTANLASVHLGGEAGLATADSQWRIGAKALWSRNAGETTSENVTLLLTQESRHRWSGRTWFWERLSLAPSMRSGEPVRGSLDTGLAIALTRLSNLHLGLTQRYDGAARPDTRFVTGIAVRLD